jgi:predicted ribosome quality control (RQC) complex YloA/Tae2 family protein
VILTDHEYTILSLLRSHKFDETAKIQIKEKYPFTEAAGMTIDSVTVDPEIIRKFIAGVDPNKAVEVLPPVVEAVESEEAPGTETVVPASSEEKAPSAKKGGDKKGGK